MAKHKSAEAKRLTELGRALEEWSDVLYNDSSVFDMMAGDAVTARELATISEMRSILADYDEDVARLADEERECDE